MMDIVRNLKTVNLIKILHLEKMQKPLLFSIAIVAFILLNIILAPVALRLDLSKGKAYTLSPSTKKIIKNLDKNVQITFFVTSDLPTKLLPLKTEVTDLLKEYEKQGNKIQVKIVDPKQDANALKQAQEARIPEVQFSQLDQDKYAVSTSYFGIEVKKDTTREVIPQVTDVESLEYNLTAAIYKLTRKTIPKIGIIGSSPVLDPRQDPIGAIRSVLEKQFILEPITIATEGGKTSIDSSYAALLVFEDQTKQYDSFQLNVIKSYIDNKGKALFFTDGVWVDEGLNAQPSQSNLLPLLSAFGITVQKNLVLSTSAELVNFGNDLVNIYTPYPFWLKTNMFNARLSYFGNVAQLTFPWVSEIVLQETNEYKPQFLVKTTPQSWIQKDTFILNPQQIPQPQQSDAKEFVIAAQSIKPDGGQVVVFSSSRFILSQFLSRSSGNLALVLNILNDIASGGALSGINQRAIGIYPLPPLDQSVQNVFKYANIILLPALFVVYGVIRLWRRK